MLDQGTPPNLRPGPLPLALLGSTGVCYIGGRVPCVLGPLSMVGTSFSERPAERGSRETRLGHEKACSVRSPREWVTSPGTQEGGAVGAVSSCHAMRSATWFARGRKDPRPMNEPPDFEAGGWAD